METYEEAERKERAKQMHQGREHTHRDTYKSKYRPGGRQAVRKEEPIIYSREDEGKGGGKDRVKRRKENGRETDKMQKTEQQRTDRQKQEDCQDWERGQQGKGQPQKHPT